jgi:AbrB family looped-hinge helix DNA binding protein
MPETTISPKYQVVIPKEVRKKLKIKEGQKLNVYPLGDSIILSPQPQNYTEKMLGLGKEIWKGVDPLEYIRQERLDWDKKYGR